MDELDEILLRFPQAADHAAADVQLYAGEMLAGNAGESLRDRVEEALLQKMQRRRHADRAYWRQIIATLKRLRADDQLEVMGSQV
jgi:hypothetical protein